MTSEYRTQLKQEIDRRARERAAHIEAAERADRAAERRLDVERLWSTFRHRS